MDQFEFWDEFNYLRDEIYSATLSWHSYLTVNREINGSEELLDAINRHPSFWRITLNALQHNTIVVLGRLFDKNSDSRSIREIVKACKAHPEFFSRAALRARRLHDDAKAADQPWFEEYIGKAFEPDAEHFNELEIKVNEAIAIWDSAYAPIRNKVVAHRDKLSKDAVSAMFAKTKVSEITGLLERLHDISEAIGELGMNAKRLEFPHKVNSRVAEAEKAAKGMLEAILKSEQPSKTLPPNPAPESR
jgi:hypothetical protein